MRSPPRESSSVGEKQRVQEVQEIGKGKGIEKVYTPCWNVRKSSQLTSVDEKKEWVENILPPGARTKFEIYKADEPCMKYNNIYNLVFCWCCYNNSRNYTE